MAKHDNDSVFSLRLPARDAERLTREARSRGITISAMVRQAIFAGLGHQAAGWLSYGIPDQQPGATLSISMVGIGWPETPTAGGLTLEIRPIVTD